MAATRKKRAGKKGGNPKPKTSHLNPPWKKGFAPNPKGSSATVRRRTVLKDAIQEALKAEIPEGWKAKIAEMELDGGLSSDPAKDATFLSEIVTRIVVAALRGDQKAIDQLLSTEPKAIEAEIGINDTTEDDAADSLDAIAQRRRKKGSAKRA